MQYFNTDKNALIFSRQGETLRIEAWGTDGLRVRATQNADFSGRDHALLPQENSSAIITECPDGMHITNGNIKAVVSKYGRLNFYNQHGRLLLSEYYRSFAFGGECPEDLDTMTNARFYARQYKPHAGENSHITLRFEANDGEKLYGMGQYQHQHLDLKGCSLELAHRNTQASVPFAFSSLGYGFLWNNPAIGKAVFGKNVTEWEAFSSKEIDYWITAGDSPAQIIKNYTAVTGRVPVMPDYGMGFWQCKLRYQTQEEIMEVARGYKKRNIPLSVIVIDFFHWPHQGDWCFDPVYWPDPEAMCRELEEMGIKVMVSVWPTVERKSANFQEMMDKNLLVHTERGIPVNMEAFDAMCCFFDATNSEARDFVWDKCKHNYRDLGVTLFWLDEAEPEYSFPDFELYRYHAGSALEVSNIYPAMYAKTFYDGMRADGEENPVSLIRCAWAGSQRYGALAWSGDVPSTYTQLKNQIQAGLNMGMAGIAWWTADIGGFHGGSVNDPAFHELLIRWFEYGTFCPVMRLHGDREPHSAPLSDTGGGIVSSGAPNEVWSYTPELEQIMTRYIRLREALRPYISNAMQEAHDCGTPIIKPLFYDFPNDAAAWDAKESYLFGHDILVAPVTEPGVLTREVYLPTGAVWTEVATGKEYQGGQTVAAHAPLDTIPLFIRDCACVAALLK